MKNLLKSGMIALFMLIGIASVSQAQGMVRYTYIDGNFKSLNRTLPFKSFSAYVYDYGSYSSVSGNLYSYTLDQLHMRSVSVCFSGRVNSRGVLTGTFRYNHQNYSFTGSYNDQNGGTIATVKATGKSTAVAQMIGKERKQSYRY